MTGVAIVAALLILVIFIDTFETMILPRRVTRKYRLVRTYYRIAWGTWARIHRMLRSPKLRDRQLSYFGPLSLLWLFAIWAAALIIGFFSSGESLVSCAHEVIFLPASN